MVLQEQRCVRLYSRHHNVANSRHRHYVRIVDCSTNGIISDCHPGRKISSRARRIKPQGRNETRKYQAQRDLFDIGKHGQLQHTIHHLLSLGPYSLHVLTSPPSLSERRSHRYNNTSRLNQESRITTQTSIPPVTCTQVPARVDKGRFLPRQWLTLSITLSPEKIWIGRRLQSHENGNACRILSTVGSIVKGDSLQKATAAAAAIILVLREWVASSARAMARDNRCGKSSKSDQLSKIRHEAGSL